MNSTSVSKRINSIFNTKFYLKIFFSLTFVSKDFTSYCVILSYAAMRKIFHQVVPGYALITPSILKIIRFAFFLSQLDELRHHHHRFNSSIDLNSLFFYFST